MVAADDLTLATRTHTTSDTTTIVLQQQQQQQHLLQSSVFTHATCHCNISHTTFISSEFQQTVTRTRVQCRTARQSSNTYSYFCSRPKTKRWLNETRGTNRL